MFRVPFYPLRFANKKKVFYHEMLSPEKNKIIEYEY